MRVRCVLWLNIAVKVHTSETQKYYGIFEWIQNRYRRVHDIYELSMQFTYMFLKNICWFYMFGRSACMCAYMLPLCLKARRCQISLTLVSYSEVVKNRVKKGQLRKERKASSYSLQSAIGEAEANTQQQPGGRNWTGDWRDAFTGLPSLFSYRVDNCLS